MTEIPSIKYSMLKKGKKLGPNDLCSLETFKGNRFLIQNYRR